MDLSAYREDTEKREKGSPLYLEDVIIYIRRFGVHQSEIEMTEVRRKLYDFNHRNENFNKTVAHWLVEYGVTGWDGEIEGCEFSKQNLTRILLNPELEDSFIAILINHAVSYGNYLHDEVDRDIETIKKN
ncbi:MAG: hypothetical protein ACJAYB_000006 [Psychromonas sp.]|jgi:hypothetical protein